MVIHSLPVSLATKFGPPPALLCGSTTSGGAAPKNIPCSDEGRETKHPSRCRILQFESPVTALPKSAAFIRRYQTQRDYPFEIKAQSQAMY